MQALDRITTKHLQTNEIIEIDLSQVSIKDQLVIIDKVDLILKNNTGMVYFLIDCTESSYNWNTTISWKNVVNKYEFVQYRVGLYGANWIRRILIKFINLAKPHSVTVFKTRTEAEQHIIENMML